MRKLLALTFILMFTSGCTTWFGDTVVVTGRDVPIKIEGGTFVTKEQYLDMVNGMKVKADLKSLEGSYYLSPRVIDIDGDGNVTLKK